MPRLLPNIIITGTPGVGKTTHAIALAAAIPELHHLDINAVVRTQDCSSGYDSELQTTIVDEDKLLDAIDAYLRKGGQIVDWHACDLFPEDLIDLVVVVRCGTEGLFDRLTKRGYGERKLGENMDAEIMQVVLEEAREGYEEGVVVEVTSDTVEEVEANVERLEEWVKRWREDHPDGVGEED